MDRVPLDDSDFPELSIEPRPLGPRLLVQQDGATEADRLLAAIVLVARKEQTPATKGA
jgi:hypothetical protein